MGPRVLECIRGRYLGLKVILTCGRFAAKVGGGGNERIVVEIPGRSRANGEEDNGQKMRRLPTKESADLYRRR